MVDDKKPSGLIELWENPLIKEFGIPLIKQKIKEDLGISRPDKELNKSKSSRFIYNLRDFLQGTWWIVVLFSFGMMVTFILYLCLRKWLGV